MSRYLARLAKLEANQPPLPVLVAEREPLDFAQIVADIEGETAWVATLPPKQKIAHHLQHIADQRREAALPPKEMPHLVPGLAERFHACVKKGVKDDFPTQRYEIRACELELLNGAGYDTRDLQARHQKWRELPWQWCHLEEALPPEARAYIDDQLFEYL